MRIRNKDKNNVVKVGIFIAGLTAVLMVMIANIGKENSIFEPKVDIKARVSNVSNLKPGSYVELKGIRVGSVSDINIVSEDEVEIIMTILKKELKWIKDDSKVTISTAGLVGDKFVEINRGTKSAGAFDPDKNVLLSEDLMDLKKIMYKGDSIATVTDRILTKLDLILHNLGDGKTIVDTVNSLNRASSNLEQITTDLNRANMGKAVSNFNSSMTNLDKASSSLTRILNRVEHGPGTMNSFIYDDGLHDELRALLGGAQRNKVIKYYIRESIKNAEKRKPKAD
jgi:ABC-type transporter Mla subunit MlaD